MRVLTLAALLLAAPLHTAQAQDRWLHVAVDGGDDIVRVNLPLTLVTTLAPLVAKHADAHFLELNDHELSREELVQIVTAVRGAKDGEYVTVQDGDGDVRISKKGAFLTIQVDETNRRGKAPSGERVEVKMPLDVIVALISGDEDKLDLAAALQALAKHGSGDLVTVKDDGETVRVWIDDKSAS
jgi:hypothetical protein